MLVPRATETTTPRLLVHRLKHGTNAVQPSLELLVTWPALNSGSLVVGRPATPNHEKENTDMPYVKGKKYAYTKDGMKKAKKAAKKAGSKVTYRKRK